jgi:arylsulfatase A-like enzyme
MGDWEPGIYHLDPSAGRLGREIPLPSKFCPSLRFPTPQKVMLIKQSLLALRSLVLISLSVASVTLHADEESRAPYNVLFIAIDDMNDWVGAFGGAPQAQSATPRMDKFAQGGSVVFQQANCAGPICCPSRSALLSGFMPNRTGVYTNSENMRSSELVQTHLTLPEYFSQHGYRTLSTGKVFHKHPGDEGQWAFDEWAPSEGGSGSRPDPAHVTTRNRNLIDGKPAPYPPVKSDGDEGGEGEGTEFAWGPTRGPKEESKDWKSAEWAVAQLAKPSAKPFFLALGISKPHLPWYVPQEYFDRHPLDSIKLPDIRLDDLDDIIDPRGDVKFKPSSDFRWAHQDPNIYKGAVRGYLAASSLADDCVGHVLDALEKSPARDNTIVVIWGDHGWHLGEKLRFRKSTLWAESTRLPLTIRVPGMKSRQDCSRLVNLMDLYPTLIELCGLPAKPEIDGRSIVPLLRNPQTPWPYPSITVNGAGNASVRDERWYFIRYLDGTEELYDMERDPMQWTNLARSKDPAVHSQMTRLAASFPAFFAPDVPSKFKNKDENEERSGVLDLTIRPARRGANLK